MNKTTCAGILLICAVLFCGLVAGAQQARPIVIEHVTLIDGTGRAPVADATVVVNGERIARIAQGPIAVPANAQHIDGRGKYLLPGLMDVHVHVRGAQRKPASEREGTRALQSYLYCGVTTVLDVGNDTDFIFHLRDLERSGKILSTRLLAAGPIVTYPGSHGTRGGMAIEVDSWQQAIPALEKHIEGHTSHDHPAPHSSHAAHH